MKQVKKNEKMPVRRYFEYMWVLIALVTFIIPQTTHSSELTRATTTNVKYVIVGNITKKKAISWKDTDKGPQFISQSVSNNIIHRRIKCPLSTHIKMYKLKNAIIWRLQNGIATNIYRNKKVLIKISPGYPAPKYKDKRYFFIVEDYKLPAKLIREKNLQDYLIFRLLEEGKLFPEGTDMFNMELKRYNITPKDIKEIDQRRVE
jgi:hypothetical protein